MPHSIPLTRGQVTLVDDADYARLRRWRWRFTSNGYAARTVHRDGKTTTVLMHRFLLGAQPGQTVDHIDGNRLNNTRANLRLVTPIQNQQNRKITTRSRSGFKGVTASGSRWLARIHVDGRQIHLGYHDTAQQAALTYDHAARRFFGRYARVNLPDMPEMGAYRTRLDHILAGTQPKRKRQPGPQVPKACSRYTGVYWDRGRWRASIRVQGKKCHLGYFLDEVQVARAYDAAAVARDGERALLNFPGDP